MAAELSVAQFPGSVVKPNDMDLTRQSSGEPSESFRSLPVACEGEDMGACDRQRWMIGEVGRIETPHGEAEALTQPLLPVSHGQNRAGIVERCAHNTVIAHL